LTRSAFERRDSLTVRVGTPGQVVLYIGLLAQGWARDVEARDRDETYVGHETSPRR